MISKAKIKAKLELFLEVGRFDAARRFIQELNEKQPSAYLHNWAGVILHKQSLFSEAIAEFEQALALEPAYAEAGFNLAATVADMGCYDQAGKAFQSALQTLNTKTHPVTNDLIQLHRECAERYRELGLAGPALAELQKALALSERSSEVMVDLARLQMELGNFAEAVRCLEQVSGEDSEALVLLGVAYYRLGKMNNARVQWERARAVAPDDPTVRAYFHTSSSWVSS